MLIFLCFLALACQPTEAIKDLEETGDIPVLDRIDTLEGVDKNKDGIRDDIEAYIDRLNFTDEQRSAIRFLAYTQQKTLTYDTSNVDVIRQLGKEAVATINCLDTKFENDEDVSVLITSIESKTVNTKLRSMQYMKYNQAASGTVTKLPSGDTCEEH